MNSIRANILIPKGGIIKFIEFQAYEKFHVVIN